jgi:AraC-like DNA-binding protein
MELKDKRIDPSEVKQRFEEIQLSVHCCRYWKFSGWSFGDLSAPFWRFYYNELPGAIVKFKDNRIELNSGTCVLIPPNTAFSISTLYDKQGNSESIVGSRMEEGDRMDLFLQKKMFDHFFVHFNLGLKYDSYPPGLYQFSNDDVLKMNIGKVKQHLKTDHQNVPFGVLVYLYQIIFHALAELPTDKWESFNYDPRVISTLNFIDQNLHTSLTNVDLAASVNLATNSFARLFRENMGISLQHYILRKRLEKSLHMLHHTQAKMERIALECGFYDLHHFSRVFKANMQVSPSVYKKRSTMS